MTSHGLFIYLSAHCAAAASVFMSSVSVGIMIIFIFFCFISILTLCASYISRADRLILKNTTRDLCENPEKI